jgi:hypothetical protein
MTPNEKRRRDEFKALNPKRAKGVGALDDKAVVRLVRARESGVPWVLLSERFGLEQEALHREIRRAKERGLLP